MMLTLYHAPLACSLAVRFALAETGLEHELVVLDLAAGEGQSSDYRRLNPNGQVPALKTEAGVLTENSAILSFLADSCPDAELLPIAPFERAKAMSWLAWMVSSLHPAFTRLLRPERFTTTRESEQAVQESALAALTVTLGRVDFHLSDNAGILPRHSVCDLYLLVFALWRASPALAGKLSVHPELDRWQAQMLQRTGLMACVADDMQRLAAQRRSPAA